MRFLKFDDFSGKVGESYEILAGDHPVSVTLSDAEEVPGMPREGGAFRLIFTGPVEPVLPQGIYSFRRGAEDCEIFIVPVAHDQAGTQYEAVFA